MQLKGFPSRGAESAGIAEMIGEAIARHPAWRIAVLVRAKSHAREIAASLRARGIAFRAVDIEPLQDRAAVRDIIMLTCALLHLGDRIAWLAVLARALVRAHAGRSVADRTRRTDRVGCDSRRCRVGSAQRAMAAPAAGGCARQWRPHLLFAMTVPWRAGSREPGSSWAGRAASHRGRNSSWPAQHSRASETSRNKGMPDAADLPHSFADLFADHGEPAPWKS